MNRDITILLLMMASLFGCQRMLAQTEAADALVLLLKDGTSHSYKLAEKPVVTFDSEKSVIKTSDFETSLEDYNYADISKLYFADGGSASVEGVEVKGISFSFTDGSHVIIKGVDEKVTVTVTSLDAKDYHSSIKRGQDSVAIDLSSAPSGVYIIKVNNNSYKIIKR